jgi:hypothetical protein
MKEKPNEFNWDFQQSEKNICYNAVPIRHIKNKLRGK